MLKILITGGAGYIGSVLTEYLLRSKNNKVTIVDNFYYNQSSLNHLCHYENLEILKTDVRNYESYKNEIKNSDIIIPLAALVGAPICNFDPVGSDSINFDAPSTLFKNISESQLIIMPTTNSAYGTSKSSEKLDEESQLNPISRYAIKKVELEKKLIDRKNSISLRLATVFGVSPRMRTDLLVNDFTYKALTDKYLVLFESSFIRNYIHVRDVSRLIKEITENQGKFKDNIFNVGLSDTNISKKELANKIKKQIPNLVIHENNFQSDPDQRNYLVSNDKLDSTGFKTQYSLEYGIKELIKGYKMMRSREYNNLL